MYKLENSPLTISGIFKNGWELYKSSLLHVLVWSLVIAILHVIPYLFRFVGFFHRDITGHLAFSWVGLSLFFILLIAESFFLILFFYTIYSLAKEQKVELAKAFKVARNQMWHLYIAMVAFFVMVNIAVLVLVIPGLFILILFSMVLPYIVIEHQTVYNSFYKSARLVWGNWWQTFFVLVLPYGITFFIRNTLKFVHLQGEWMYLVDIILLTLVMPYYYSVLMVQFNNLKIIKSLPDPISQRPRTDHLAD